jgi:SAM-dependent methyltransferase
MIIDQNQIWTTQQDYVVSYPSEGSGSCFEFEDNSFWFRHRNQVIEQAINRYGIVGNGDFLDVGGGNGLQVSHLTKKMPSHRFILAEPSYQGCLNARKRGCAHVYNVTFQEFPFQEFSVGAVGLFDVLEHIEDDAGFLAELASFLPAGARVYLTVPAHGWLWSDTDDFAGHFRRYNRPMIAKLAERAGLNLLFETYFFSYLVPLTFLFRRLPYRWRGKRGQGEILATESEQHQPSVLVNKAFGLGNALETRLLRQGRVPFGGSCLAVMETKNLKNGTN